MTDEVKKVTKTYAMAMAWWFLNASDRKTPTDRIEKAKVKLEKAEEFLKANGVTDQALEDIGRRAEDFVNTPPDKMTDAQQELYAKLIFGPQVVSDGHYTQKDLEEQKSKHYDKNGKLVDFKWTPGCVKPLAPKVTVTQTTIDDS